MMRMRMRTTTTTTSMEVNTDVEFVLKIAMHDDSISYPHREPTPSLRSPRAQPKRPNGHEHRFEDRAEVRRASSRVRCTCVAHRRQNELPGEVPNLMPSSLSSVITVDCDS
eukprot:4806814-Pyramimonas_sp.AAC.1